MKICYQLTDFSNIFDNALAAGERYKHIIKVIGTSS